MIPPQHMVQFHDEDVFLTESVASLTKVGLRVNDTVIIVATASHRKNFRKVLTPDELANKNLIFFDAASLLLKIMVEDWPDQSKFMEVLGSRIQKAGQKGRVRMFGEMVAVLWPEGEYLAAIRLEELWNTLQAIQPFSLLHAYPHSVFTSKEDLIAICQTHTEVHHQTASYRGSTATSMVPAPYERGTR